MERKGQPLLNLNRFPTQARRPVYAVITGLALTAAACGGGSNAENENSPKDPDIQVQSGANEPKAKETATIVAPTPEVKVLTPVEVTNSVVEGIKSIIPVSAVDSLDATLKVADMSSKEYAIATSNARNAGVPLDAINALGVVRNAQYALENPDPRSSVSGRFSVYGNAGLALGRLACANPNSQPIADAFLNVKAFALHVAKSLEDQKLVEAGASGKFAANFFGLPSNCDNRFLVQR